MTPSLNALERFNIFRYILDSVYYCLKVSLHKKIQERILRSENKFCVSLRNKLIQNLSNHGALKEPKNPCIERILWFFWRASWFKWCWLDPFSGETQNSFSDLTIKCWIFLKNCTLIALGMTSSLNLHNKKIVNISVHRSVIFQTGWCHSTVI